MSAGFGWVLLAVTIYGVVHSALASLRFKAWVRVRFGEANYRFYRLFYTISAGVTLLPVLALAWRQPDAPFYTIPAPWMWVTLSLQAAAGVCFALALLQTGTSDFLGAGVLFRSSTQDQPQQLATSGFYRWTRHPLYFFGLVMVWLMPVMSWNFFALSLGSTIYIVVGAWLEEHKLLMEFGEPYAAYRRRTPFLIPFLKKGM